MAEAGLAALRERVTEVGREDLELTAAVLELEARSVAAKLDAAAAADDSTTSYVERLEEMSDESRLPSGDELIGEIERFLRGGDPEGAEGGGTAR